MTKDLRFTSTPNSNVMYRNIPTSKDCEANCASDSTCKAYNYNTDAYYMTSYRRRCIIISILTGSVKDDGVVSGKPGSCRGMYSDPFKLIFPLRFSHRHQC